MMTTPTPGTRLLSDAVTLYAIRTEKFKLARLSLTFILPADADKSPLRALFFRCALKGTEHYPTLAAISREMDRLYGTIMFTRNVLIGDSQVISLNFDMMEDVFVPASDEKTDILGGVLSLLGDMILHPLLDGDGLLPAGVVEDCKQTQIHEIRAERSDTRAYAEERLWLSTFEGELCGISLLGSTDLVSAATPETVTAAWREMLSAARVELFYIGRADADTVAAKWREAFGAWSPRPCPLPPAMPHTPPVSPRRGSEDMAVSQSKLCMSWSGGPTVQPASAPAESQRAYAAALVLNEMLGVMQSSLLFRRVREAQGLCYYCESDYNAEKGVLTVSCGIRPDHASAAEESIRALVNGVREGQFTENDVALAKLSLTNEYRGIPDNQGAMESFWFRQELAGTEETPESLITRLNAVTREDVEAAAARFCEDSLFCLCGTRPASGTSGEGETGEEENA